jgi:hypothetical protein
MHTCTHCGLPCRRLHQILPGGPGWMALKVLLLVATFAYLGALGWLECVEGWALIALGFGMRHLLTEK